MNGRLIHRSLVIFVLLMLSFVPACATTTLSLAISGEPWKDPSISQVGTKLSLATPPSTGIFGLGWSSSVAGAMGVNWQVKKAGAVVANGSAALTKAAAPNSTVWIFIPSTFIAATAPASPVDYDITVAAFDASHNPLGATSAPVVITQTAEKSSSPGLVFGRNTIYPSVKLDRYKEDFGQVPLTQLQFAMAHVKITIENKGPSPTDKVFLYIKDDNVLMRQAIPITVDSMAPGAAKVITLVLSAVLPPAQSQMPQEQQFHDWYQDYHARGVDLRVVMDFAGAKNNAPLNDHSEVALYKGNTDSCADGKKDGDETPGAECGGSCDCCFGKNIETSWWRDIYGFNFGNTDAFTALTGKYGLDDVQALFGTCSIYVGCPLLYIPDPFALSYLAIVKVAIDGHGRCFGFSLAALSFLHGDESLSNYPMDVGGGCDTWHLVSPLKQPSSGLAEMIRHKHMYQMTNGAWLDWLEARDTTDTSYWRKQLTASLPAILSLCDHAVIVLSVSDTNEGFVLNLADPNVPFQAGELDNPTLYNQQLGFNTITVSGGHYTFVHHGDTACEGNAADDFTVFSYSSLQNPTMPSDPASMVALGSATKGAIIGQVTDASGHKLLLADGSVNRDPASRMRAYPLFPIDGRSSDGPVRTIIADASQTFTHTIVPSGEYEVVFLGPNYMAHIDQASGVASETDDITVDPRTASLGLVTKAASKALRAELTVRAPDKSVRRAVARLTLSANKKAQLEFDAQRETLSYHHEGPAAQLSLALWSSQNPDMTVTSAPLAVEDGDIVSVKPDWAAIDKSAPTAVNRVKRGGVTRQLPLR